MSDLLNRIVREIRERLAASHAAVLEHERLETALQALEDTAARATRTVSGRSSNQRDGARAPSAKRSRNTNRRAAATTSAGGKRRASTAATTHDGQDTGPRSLGAPGRSAHARAQARAAGR